MDAEIEDLQDELSELRKELDEIRNQLVVTKTERDNLRNVVKEARDVTKTLAYDLGNA
jgi:uncharacterized coiled-coil DUF342 family protein